MSTYKVKDKTTDRLQRSYPYYRSDGFPDLVYDEKTSVYACVYCSGDRCVRCLNSGYLFLDSNRYRHLILEVYGRNLGFEDNP